MKKGNSSQVWKIILITVLIIVGNSLGVTSQCVYTTERCICNSDNQVKCIGLTEMPVLAGNISVKDLHQVEFIGGNLTNFPPFPPGITTAVFEDVPLTNVSVLDVSTTSLRSLRISGADFRRLPEVFQKLENLTILGIMDTPIDDWDNSTLASLAKSLITLSLVNVNLTKWPSEFSQLYNLNRIVIQDNPITNFPNDSFTIMADTLKRIYLENLGLTSIPIALSVLKNANKIKLSGNKLTDVKSGFKMLSSSSLARTLEELDMSSSGLTEMPDLGAFSSLRTIHFDHNQFSSINIDSPNLPTNLIYFTSINCSLSSFPPIMQSLHQLYSVNLKLNQLTNIDFDIFPKNVNVLWLNNNQISKFTSENQTGNESVLLEELYLDHNLLSTIPKFFKDLSKLSILDLSYNRIEEINFDSFPPNLTRLDLFSNMIAKIADSKSSSPSLVTFIDLSFNPIIIIERLAFINLINLESFYLISTMLTGIPTSLMYLPALKDLQVLSNPNMACLCPVDRDLVEWFASRNGSLHIIGSCIHYVNIVEYYTDYCNRTLTSTTTLASTTHNNSGQFLTTAKSSLWFMFSATMLYIINLNSSM